MDGNFGGVVDSMGQEAVSPGQHPAVYGGSPPIGIDGKAELSHRAIPETGQDPDTGPEQPVPSQASGKPSSPRSTDGFPYVAVLERDHPPDHPIQIDRRVQPDPGVASHSQVSVPIGGPRRSGETMDDEVVSLTKDQEIAAARLGRPELHRQQLTFDEGRLHAPPGDVHGPAASRLSHQFDSGIQ